MKISINDSEPYYTINNTIKEEIEKFIIDFENSPDDDTNPEWMSDGEWLDRALDIIRSIYIRLPLL